MNYILTVSTEERGELRYGLEGSHPNEDSLFLGRLSSFVAVPYEIKSIKEITKEEFDALNKIGNYFSDIWQ